MKMKVDHGSRVSAGSAAAHRGGAKAQTEDGGTCERKESQNVTVTCFSFPLPTLLCPSHAKFNLESGRHVLSSFLPIPCKTQGTGVFDRDNTSSAKRPPLFTFSPKLYNLTFFCFFFLLPFLFFPLQNFNRAFTAHN